MKKLMAVLLMVVPMLSLATYTGASSTGDSGERTLAEDVKDAFTDGKVMEIFDNFTPEHQAEEIRQFDSRVQGLKDQQRAEREAAIKDLNNNMWWDPDWERVKGLEDLEEFSEIDKATFQLSTYREYSSPERVRDFDERAQDLREVGYVRTHAAGLEDWGQATIEYANKWNDRLSISLVQRAGSWFVTGLEISGFQQLSQEETMGARKDKEK